MNDLMRNDDRPGAFELLAGMRSEGRRRLRPMGLLFLLVACLALLLGWFWPKSYLGVATVLVSQDKSIQKLMDGRAVATSVNDRVMIAREVITSAPVIDDVLALGGWLADDPDVAERDRRAEAIRRSTLLGAPRENLIRIEFRDGDAARAAAVAQFFAERFMQESRMAQQRESAEAYDFIAAEVAGYGARLTQADAEIASYRAAHPEARSEPAGLLEARILQLRRERELALADAGGAPTRSAAVATRTAITSGQLLDARIAELDRELESALQRFTEAHPTPRRLARQREGLLQRRSEVGVATPVAAPTATAVDAGSGSRPLPSGVAPGRIAAMDAEIDRLLERLAALSQPAEALARLLRQRDVARDLLDDLSRRLEYASLSKRLDEQGRGLGFRLQEAAAVPTQSNGLRFGHFVLAGLAAAAALPLALLFALVRFDPHLRSAAALRRGTGIPVIASIPMYWTAGDRQLLRRDGRQALAAVAFAVLLLGLASAARLVAAG